MCLPLGLGLICLQQLSIAVTEMFLNMLEAWDHVGQREPKMQYSPIAGADCMITVMPGLPPAGCIPKPSPSLSYHLCHSANPRAQLALSEAVLHYIIPSHSLTLHDRGWYTLTRVSSSSVHWASLLHMPLAGKKRVFKCLCLKGNADALIWLIFKNGIATHNASLTSHSTQCWALLTHVYLLKTSDEV